MLPVAMWWQHVLFENWPVEPAGVAARLPDALAVDTFDGQAWLSVVPFVNADVRPRGLPAALGLTLPELNLRTYVTCDGEPGVYFFSLDAEGLLGVLGARLLHHLPYYYARMSVEEAGEQVFFESRRRHPGARPVAYAANYGPNGETFRAPRDDLARFLVERYRYYTTGMEGTVRYADIDHDPWRLAPGSVETGTNTLFGANGFETPDSEPVVYYGDEIEVAATASRRWKNGTSG